MVNVSSDTIVADGEHGSAPPYTVALAPVAGDTYAPATHACAAKSMPPLPGAAEHACVAPSCVCTLEPTPAHDAEFVYVVFTYDVDDTQLIA